VNTVSDEAVR